MRPTVAWPRGRAWLQLGFAVVVFGGLLAIAQPGRIAGVLLAADLRWVGVGALLWVAIQQLNVWKWWLLDRAQGGKTSRRRLATIYYIGMFYNTFLPSGFGGDAARAYELSRDGQGAGSSIASVVVDRFASLYALVIWGSLAALFAPADLRLVPVGVVAGLNFGCAAFGLAVWFGFGLDWLAGLAFVRRRPRLVGFLDQMEGAARGLRSAPGAALAAIAIALVYQAISIVEHYCFMRALAVAVPLGYVALCYPALVLISSLPVSINGLGLREGSLIVFLSHVGASQAQAVAVGLLSMSMLMLSGAWGALLLVTRVAPPAPGSDLPAPPPAA